MTKFDFFIIYFYKAMKLFECFERERKTEKKREREHVCVHVSKKGNRKVWNAFQKFKYKCTEMVTDK